MSYQIIATNGRWNLVGRVVGFDPEHDELMLEDAAVIIRWGTEHGLGQLRHGPLSETKLGYEGTCRIPRAAILRRIEVSEAWAEVLEGLR